MQVEVNVDNDQHGAASSTLVPAMGLLTKTLSHSPVVKWMWTARIRHKSVDDVVLVGEDFVEIRHVEPGGHLCHVATKDDFDCRILGSRILGHAVNDGMDDQDNMEDIKIEDADFSDRSRSESSELPPQCLVLTLETQQLVFVFASESSDGVVNFEMTSNVPLPVSTQPLERLGKYLAVDPHSRAIAVAAPENSLVLYTVEPIPPGTRWGLGVLPVSHQRLIRGLQGTILAMDFLYPPENDPDQAVLLLVISRAGKTYLQRIDWECGVGVQSAQSHAPLPIYRGSPVPNLLIPIKSSAAFILTRGPDVWIHTNILTGHIDSQKIVLPELASQVPGISSLVPRYVAVARPRRNEGPEQTEDYLYLAREDGNVFYLALSKVRPDSGAYSSHVDTFGCHIDTAFACFGDRRENDYLAICGDMSDGGIHNVMPYAQKAGSMGSDQVSVLPNWAPTADLIVSRASRSADGGDRSSGSLFVPGGRQPYGRLTELRFGVQARSAASLAMPASIIRLWCLPVSERQGLLLLLSTPSNNSAWHIPAQLFDRSAEDYEVTGVDDIGLGMGSYMVAAGMVADDCIMQITEDAIHISQSGQRGLLHERCASGSKIVAAAISEEHDVAVTVVRKQGQSIVSLFHVTADGKEAHLQTIGEPIVLDKEIVSATISKSPLAMFAVLGTANASLLFYALHPQRGLVSMLEHSVSDDEQSLNACDDIMVLTDARQDPDSHAHRLMLLCGLRDGSLYAIDLLASEEKFFSVKSKHRYTLGYTSVRLNPDTTTVSPQSRHPLGLVAYATCGSGIFRVAWVGAGSKELSISRVWITDANEPSLQQGAVTAFAMVPSSDSIGPHLPHSLIAATSNGIFITKVESQARVVPRSMPVQASPNRAIHSSTYGCFITVGAIISVHPSSTQRGSSSRSIRPAIQFTSSGSKGWNFTYELDPGSRVHCIDECVYKTSGGEKYVFIAVGSGPIDANSNAKGEIILLKPRMRNGLVERVRATKAKTFDTAVHFLAPYGESGLVVCTGPWTYMFEYQPSEDRLKITEVCKMKHNNPGVYATASPPLVHISTSEDSLVTLLYSAENRKFAFLTGDAGARKTISHLTLDLQIPDCGPPSSRIPGSSSGNAPASTKLNIFTTRDRHVVGQLATTAHRHTTSNTATTLFDAVTSRSQIRVRHANIRPPWKASNVPGILEDRLVSTAIDGTITGLAVLESDLAHRLRWVQRLCERSAQVCPLAPRHSMNVFDGDMDEDDGLALPPLGFADGDGEQRLTKPTDMHINGDILQRLMDRGGAALLHQMLEEEAERKDGLGDWVRENLDSQLAMVEALAGEVSQTLDRWW